MDENEMPVMDLETLEERTNPFLCEAILLHVPHGYFFETENGFLGAYHDGIHEAFAALPRERHPFIHRFGWYF